MENQLSNYNEKNKIIQDCQYGFKKNLGTEDPLTVLSNILYSQKDTEKKNLSYIRFEEGI